MVTIYSITRANSSKEMKYSSDIYYEYNIDDNSMGVENEPMMGEI